MLVTQLNSPASSSEHQNDTRNTPITVSSNTDADLTLYYFVHVVATAISKPV